MTLTPEQETQIARQLEAHNHKSYTIDIKISSEYTLKNFHVHEGVLRPEIMASLPTASWLFENPALYKGKNVVDVGSGTGLLGIVTKLCGAREVIFTDINHKCVENTKANVDEYRIEAKVVEGDLLEHVQHADIIIFNHPFFDGLAAQPTVSTSMIGDQSLIHRFFDEAKTKLNPGGSIIMPYFHLAGPINDPAVQGPKHGYKVTEHLSLDNRTGLQQGRISVYQLHL